MNYNDMKNFQILGIEPTDDIRLVKKAYAEMTRKVHPEENPEEWKKIHSAYHELSTSLRASAARRVNDTGNTEERIIEAQQTGDRTGDEDSEETDGEAVGENNLRQNLGQNEEETVSEEEEIFRIIVDEQQNRDAEKSTDKAEIENDNAGKYLIYLDILQSDKYSINGFRVVTGERYKRLKDYNNFYALMTCQIFVDRMTEIIKDSYLDPSLNLIIEKDIGTAKDLCQKTKKECPDYGILLDYLQGNTIPKAEYKAEIKRLKKKYGADEVPEGNCKTQSNTRSGVRRTYLLFIGFAVLMVIIVASAKNFAKSGNDSGGYNGGIGSLGYQPYNTPTGIIDLREYQVDIGTGDTMEDIRRKLIVSHIKLLCQDGISEEELIEKLKNNFMYSDSDIEYGIEQCKDEEWYCRPKTLQQVP